MKKILLTFLLTMLFMHVNAQVGINTTLPNANAVLDIANSPGEAKGILIPRLTGSERDALTYVDSNAATKVLKLTAQDNSLLIYNTTTNRYNFWNGPELAWFNLNGGYNGPFDLPDAKLSFDCVNDVLITGVYEQTMPLSEEHDHIVSIMVNVEEIGNYSVEVISTNGYSFSASGTFLFKGKAIIRAIGSGNPLKSGKDNLMLRINGKKSNCLPTITIKSNAPMTPKRILVATEMPKLGYNNMSEYFLKTPKNFGNLTDSTVQPSEGIEVINIKPSESSYAFKLSNYLTKDNAGSKPVDILILDEEYSRSGLSKIQSKLISEYLFNGGVVIITIGDRPKNNTSDLLKEMTIPYTFSASNKDAKIITLPTIPGDIILNGPFGDLNGKVLWQSGGYQKYPSDTSKYILQTTGFLIDENYVNENLVVYSRGANGYIESFRHKKLNLFYYGNEDIFSRGYGFSLSYDFYAEPAEYRFNSFQSNTIKQDPPSYNSIFFGNIIYWALQQAQLKGINTP